MVTRVEEPTGLVLTVKVAVMPPVGTVTLAGTVATLVLLLERATTAPPLGAGPLSVTRPDERRAGVARGGLRASEESVGGVTVSEDGRVTPKDPEMWARVKAPTGLVLTVKVAVMPPVGTVTLAGTVATLVLLLERATTAPPLGAGPLSVT